MAIQATLVVQQLTRTNPAPEASEQQDAGQSIVGMTVAEPEPWPAGKQLCGKKTGDRIEISGTLLVGRGPDCGLQVGAKPVSRTQFEISVGNKVQLMDLESRNGSWVNGDKVTGTVELHDGDMVETPSDEFGQTFVGKLEIKEG